MCEEPSGLLTCNKMLTHGLCTVALFDEPMVTPTVQSTPVTSGSETRFCDSFVPDDFAAFFEATSLKASAAIISAADLDKSVDRRYKLESALAFGIEPRFEADSLNKRSIARTRFSPSSFPSTSRSV